jgi:hypothetical protein
VSIPVLQKFEPTKKIAKFANRPHTHTVMPITEGDEHWSLQVYMYMIQDSVYFDIPSLKRQAVENFNVVLRHASYREYYSPSGKGAESILQTVKDLFELYDTEAKWLDPIVVALIDEGYLKRVLEDAKLRAVLLAEPKLMMRIIEIQNGINNQE